MDLDDFFSLSKLSFEFRNSKAIYPIIVEMDPEDLSFSRSKRELGKMDQWWILNEIEENDGGIYLKEIREKYSSPKVMYKYIKVGIDEGLFQEIITEKDGKKRKMLITSKEEE